jgi:hypothetical protein
LKKVEKMEFRIIHGAKTTDIKYENIKNPDLAILAAAIFAALPALIIKDHVAADLARRVLDRVLAHNATSAST